MNIRVYLQKLKTMKKSLLILTILALFYGTNQAQTGEKATSYGEKITPDKAIEASKLSSMVNEKDTLHIKVIGTVESVCQKKGCWLKMNVGDGETMMVRFYDYGFFLPKDCEGKKIVLEGSVTKTVTSVDELRHYAEDAGKSKEEIEEIKEVEKSISFEATGVLLYE